MACELRWLPSVSTSAFHAAWAIVRGGQLTDARLAEALSQPAAALERVLTDARVPEVDFWNHVIPLSATIDNNWQLAQVALQKTGRSPHVSDSAIRALAPAMTDLERAVARLFPDLANELQLRAKPLREQWEAHGPGLLTLVGQKTEAQLIVPRADVILILPVLGGAACAHLAYNSVTVEAVLANPHLQLPEVLRLCWTLAQLNQDLPRYGELVHRQRLQTVSQLALLPPTLMAAEDLGLARYDLATLRFALEAWRVETAPSPAEMSDAVIAWWETYAAQRPAWAVALAALNRMIDDSAVTPATDNSTDRNLRGPAPGWPLREY